MTNEIRELTPLELETVSGGEGCTHRPEAAARFGLRQCPPERTVITMSVLSDMGAVNGAAGGAGHKPA